MNSWLQKGRNSVLVSFIILALVGGWAIKSSADNGTRKLYESQIAACERGNLLRKETNDRVHDQLESTQVLQSFLDSAATAREAAFQANGQPEDKKAAEAYLRLSGRLESVQFDTVPIINCKEAIKKP